MIVCKVSSALFLLAASACERSPEPQPRADGYEPQDGAAGSVTAADATSDLPADTANPPPPPRGRRGESTAAVAVAPDGGIYVTGTFAGRMTLGSPNGTQVTLDNGTSFRAAYLARYDQDGALSWAQRLTGGADSTASTGVGVAVLDDGGVVVTGTFRYGAVFGEGEARETTLAVAGVVDVFLARYGTTGELAWVRSAGGVAADFVSDVAAADGIVISGRFSDSATFGAGQPGETVLVAPPGKEAGFIARYTATGILVGAWIDRARR